MYAVSVNITILIAHICTTMLATLNVCIAGFRTGIRGTTNSTEVVPFNGEPGSITVPHAHPTPIPAIDGVRF